MAKKETNLSRKAMLAILKIASWTAKKHDKRVSDEVAQAHGAAQNAGRYRKTLLPSESNSLERVRKAATEARDFHYKNTLPWGQDGSRILTKANYFNYVGEMRKFRNQFNDAVSAFVLEYPTLRENARTLLNGLYNDSDYPTAADLQLKFDFELHFLPFPEDKDFRVDLDEEEVKEIRKQIQSQANQATAIAVRDVWNRMYEAVGRMTERLADPEAIFRDSLVSNLTELCDLLPRLNLAEDKALDELCEQVRGKLAAHSPEQLRDDKDLRKKTAMDADAILKMMAGYMGEEAQPCARS